MILCSYKVTTDTGFAPNPFWGYCTLAVCLPNHKNLNLQKGDWIVGVTSTLKLLYAMELTEDKLHFNKYYSDPRFQKKKPIMNGTWRQRCGDNMYYEKNNKWVPSKSPHHNTQIAFVKDTKHPYVFISNKFYYFGEEANPISPEFEWLICHWYKYIDDASDIDLFINWLKSEYTQGIWNNADPFDKENIEIIPIPTINQQHMGKKP